MPRLLLIISLLSSFAASSQNWVPFNPAYTYHYQHSDSSFISHSIYQTGFDSIAGNDTIWNLSRIIELCPTCPSSLGGLNPCQGCYMTDNQPHFLQRFAKASGNSWHFTDPGNLVLYADSGLNSSYLLDSVNNIYATVSTAGIQTVLGNTDSVRVLSLSNGDSIVWSKTYGLLSYPDIDHPGAQFILVGVDGPDVGETVIGPKEIFDFHPGDIFQYSGYGYVVGPPVDFYNKLDKVEILARTDYADRIEYQVSLIRNKWVNYGYYPFPATHYVSQSTLNQTYFFESNNPALQFRYPNERTSDLLDFTDFYGWQTTLNFVCKMDTDQNGLAVKTLNPDISPPYSNLEPVAASDTYNLEYKFDGWDYQLKEGLGVTVSHAWIFEIECRVELIGYVKNGDTTGTVHPDTFMLTLGIDEQAGTAFNMFPNPASDQTSIQFESPLSGMVRLINLSGKTILEHPFNAETQIELDVSDIPNGIYLVMLNHAYGTAARKLTILH